MQRNTLATQLAERVDELSKTAAQLRSKAEAAADRAEREAGARAKAQAEVKRLLRERQPGTAGQEALSSSLSSWPGLEGPRQDRHQQEIGSLKKRLAAAEDAARRSEELLAAAVARAEEEASVSARAAREARRRLSASEDAVRVRAASPLARRPPTGNAVDRDRLSFCTTSPSGYPVVFGPFE